MGDARLRSVLPLGRVDRSGQDATHQRRQVDAPLHQVRLGGEQDRLEQGQKDVRRDAVPVEQGEQFGRRIAQGGDEEVLGPEEVVVEALSFLIREPQDPAGLSGETLEHGCARPRRRNSWPHSIAAKPRDESRLCGTNPLGPVV